jgi:hypothetical protein
MIDRAARAGGTLSAGIKAVLGRPLPVMITELLRAPDRAADPIGIPPAGFARRRVDSQASRQSRCRPAGSDPRRSTVVSATDKKGPD